MVHLNKGKVDVIEKLENKDILCFQFSLDVAN